MLQTPEGTVLNTGAATAKMARPGMAQPSGTIAPTGAKVPKTGRRFVDVRQFEHKEKIDADTRRYEADGSGFLVIYDPHTPGEALKEKCLELTSVMVGTTPVPQSEIRHYPVDKTLRVLEPTHEEMTGLVEMDDGRQVLLRSELSNFGKWQKGPVYVTGKWGK